VKMQGEAYCQISPAIRPASRYTSHVRSTLIPSAKHNMESHPEHVPPAQAYRRSRLAPRLSQYVHLTPATRDSSPRVPMPRWMRSCHCMQLIMNHMSRCMSLLSSTSLLQAHPGELVYSGISFHSHLTCLPPLTRLVASDSSGVLSESTAKSHSFL
jgi:hypothetical protein